MPLKSFPNTQPAALANSKQSFFSLNACPAAYLKLITEEVIGFSTPIEGEENNFFKKLPLHIIPWACNATTGLIHSDNYAD